jgi:hypothetical protein
MRDQALVRWQWELYPRNHQDRRNLGVHIVTNPLFLMGTLGLVLAPFAGSALWALGGAAGMFSAIAAQGRGHKLEKSAPEPFEGPLDVVARIFLEQWVTFPRFVLSGGFARAWREAGRAA